VDSDEGVLSSGTLSRSGGIKMGVLTFLCASLIFGGLVAASWWTCTVTSVSTSMLLCSVVPSVLIALGFLPQIYEIVLANSGAGVSLGLIAIDSVGCIAGVVTVCITSGDVGAALAFLINVACHAVLAAMIFVYPGKAAEEEAVQGTEVVLDHEGGGAAAVGKVFDDCRLQPVALADGVLMSAALAVGHSTTHIPHDHRQVGGARQRPLRAERACGAVSCYGTDLLESLSRHAL